MATGRPPKPTALHLIEGTAQKCRMEKRALEPRIDADVGPCPDILIADARDVWNRLVRDMPPGVFRSSDRESLTLYCHQWAVLRQQIAEGEKIESKDLQAFKSLAGSLGLTPTDRSRLAVTQPKTEENAFAALG